MKLANKQGIIVLLDLNSRNYVILPPLSWVGRENYCGKMKWGALLSNHSSTIKCTTLTPTLQHEFNMKASHTNFLKPVQL